MATFKFCPRCGTRANRQPSPDRDIYACPNHGVIFDAPLPIAEEPAAEPAAATEAETAPKAKREPKALN
jgi:hypothetical protein